MRTLNYGSTIYSRVPVYREEGEKRSGRRAVNKSIKLFILPFSFPRNIPSAPQGSDAKRKDVPSGFVKKGDGSPIRNEEDDR